MPNRECNVTKRVQTSKGLRYCRVVLAANAASSRMLSLWMTSRRSTRKARTTSNGAKGHGASGSPWGTTPRCLRPEASEERTAK